MWSSKSCSCESVLWEYWVSKEYILMHKTDINIKAVKQFSFQDILGGKRKNESVGEIVLLK